MSGPFVVEASCVCVVSLLMDDKQRVGKSLAK